MRHSGDGRLRLERARLGTSDGFVHAYTEGSSSAARSTSNSAGTTMLSRSLPSWPMRMIATGIGVAGVYTYDVARTKIEVVEALAREHEFPLRLTMEPEEI